jgi:GTP-binding protein
VLDASGSEGRDPVHDFSVINEELALYNPGLAHKKQIVAANKTDMIDDPEKLQKIQAQITEMGYECYPVSALSGEGIRPLIERIWTLLQEIPPEEKAAEGSRTIVYEDSKKDEFTVERNPDGSFDLKGRRIERLVSMIDFDDEQALLRFQKAWRYMGLDKLLKRNGIKEGDTVRVSGAEFIYSESGEEQES